ncbi:cytochrome C [Zhengella mangrovi]|uniref:Cytochrome C n=1 Tax=Zhengella mangrovi TaxID=1982044 RepID=A0A2G1QTD8_9HYPH|nr:cytochrome c [Zhengella mangrovi]PHP68488.1 cytochrome C [Zhengella mangrovi]
MREVIVMLAAALVLTGAAAGSIALWPIGHNVRNGATGGDAARGAYLARMAGCIACHTDTKGGGAPLAGGVELKTDFGTFVTPNLTTDRENGIGAWTLADFDRAVRQGISPSGEPYYPAFPYPFYARFTDQDIADLWAAFQTVPAVAARARSHTMGFPFGFRPGIKIWRAAFVDLKPFTPDPGRSEAWNRGKYIVEGPAHCGACHTPRNLFGARLSANRFHGSTSLPNGGKAPPITAEHLKKKGWSEQDLAYALQTGLLPDGDAFGGAMAEVVSGGTAFLTEKDRLAIATYLLETR